MVKQEKINSLLLFSLSLIAIIVLVIMHFSKPGPVEIVEVPYDFSVKEMLSIVGDADLLHFGGGPAGTTLKRSMEVQADRPVTIVVSSKGPGKLVVNKNRIVLDANETEILSFALTVPDIDPGFYEGIVYFSFYEGD